MEVYNKYHETIDITNLYGIDLYVILNEGTVIIFNLN